MIICFEGASAIGKTTLCQLLSENYLIVPEVNVLFKKETGHNQFLYYEKQLERYQLCQQAKKDTILDGDIFQPIWYSWIYNYPIEFPSLEETIYFYRKIIKEGIIQFPDVYILFQTDLDSLKKRKEKDITRKRRNFEKHLQLINPQKRYFNFIKENTNIPVEFVDYNDIELTKDRVLNIISSTENKNRNDEDNFNKIVDWISRTESN